MYQQVVDKGARGCKQAGILCLSVGKLRGIIRRDALYQIECTRPAHFDFAHMTHVKQARRCARGQMLAHDARVFHGHIPPAKIHHFRTHAAMRGIERSLAELRCR